MEALRRIRRSQGMSQDELAEKTGVSKNTISQIETGHREGRPETLLKLAGALSVGIGELFGDKPAPNPELERRVQEAESTALKLERQNWKLLHAWRTFLDSVAMRWERKGEKPTPSEVHVVLGALEMMMTADVFEPGEDVITRSEVELIHKAVGRLHGVAEEVLAKKDATQARHTFEAIEAQASAVAS